MREWPKTARKSKGKEWGVADEHGVAVCCACANGWCARTIARSAVDAGFRVEVGVYGVFARAALREAAHSVREKQGLVPDLQLDDSHCELKGIRVGS
jgi:hypothetical protein